MKAALILTVILSLSACKKTEPETTPGGLPIRTTISGVKMIDYFPPKETFNCVAPSNWSVEELESSGDETISFRDGSTSILIDKNPDGNTKNPEDWANLFAVFEKDAKPPVLEKSELNGRQIIQLSRNQPLMKLHSNKVNYVAKERHALIPIPGGFYDIRLSAHPNDYAAALPIFEAVVKSFKPKS